MPTVEYQDDKYFRLMMLSLLIHDFIHEIMVRLAH